MNTDRPASGSRWEPPADPADPTATAEITAQTAAPDIGADTAVVADEPAAARAEAVADPQHPGAGFAAPYEALAWSGAPPTGRPRRGRARLAAGAAGLLVLGGIGGYWLGHTTGAPAAGAGVGTHQHRDRGGPGDGVQAPGGGPAPAPGGGTAGGGTAAGGAASGGAAA